MDGIHAYIVCGGDADSREALAAQVAQNALGGRNFATEEGKFAHPDLHEVYPNPPESNPNSTNLEIRIADSREVRETAQIKPNDAPLHVFVFHDADKMNTQAQNALLATVEEPPTPCLFLFICQNERSLLGTIRSRCAVLRASSDAQTSGDEIEITAEHTRFAQALMLKLSPAEACEAVLPLAKLRNDAAVEFVNGARAVCLRTAARADAGSDDARSAIDGADRAAKCLDMIAANVNGAQIGAWVVSLSV